MTEPPTEDPLTGDEPTSCGHLPCGHTPVPPNSTFSARKAARAGKPPTPRAPRGTLRAGTDAEQDFTIITSGKRTTSVRPIKL